MPRHRPTSKWAPQENADVFAEHGERARVRPPRPDEAAAPVWAESHARDAFMYVEVMGTMHEVGGPIPLTRGIWSVRKSDLARVDGQLCDHFGPPQQRLSTSVPAQP